MTFVYPLRPLDRVAISVAGKTIQEDLGLTLQQWGRVLGAFVLAYGVFEVPSGAMGDRMGPGRVLTRIVVWWSVFTSLTGAACSFLQMLVVRFLFGAGEAGAFPNIFAMIVRWFPVVERARAQRVVWMATRIGGAVTLLLVLPIQQAFGWRTSFYIFGMLGLLRAGIWFWWFRDHPREKPGIPHAEADEINEGPGAKHDALQRGTVLRQPNLWWIMLMYHANAWCGFFFLSWLHIFFAEWTGVYS